MHWFIKMHGMVSRLKRYDALILIVLAIAVAGVLSWRIPLMMRAPYEKAKMYCDGEHVADVAYSPSTYMIKVLSSLLGGGATYYPSKGESFSCSVVAPDGMTDACRAMGDVTDWVFVCENIGTMKNKMSFVPGADPLNATYRIDGMSFALVDGLIEREIVAGSASRDIVSVFGAPVYADLNDDGHTDAVVFLRRTGSGTGTFYYLAVALRTDYGFVGTDALLLGDRVAPDNLSIRTGIILANYADRASDENFSVPPSIAKTLYAHIHNDELVVIPEPTRGSLLFYGTLSLGATNTFRSCDNGQPSYKIADDSPFLADIAAMFGGEVGSVHAVVSGVVVNEEVMYINSLVRLSSSASCESDDIILDTPRGGDVISSPLHISGQAQGTWFFEASFPVVLTDWDGRIIAQGVAQADGDWMTTDFVPFDAALTFSTPAGGAGIPDTGSLILKKDNPSGLPEHDASIEVLVRFR